LYLLLFSLFFLRLRTMFYGYYFFDFMSFHRPSGGLIYILFGHLIFALPAMAVGLYSHDRLQVRLSVSLVLSFAVFLALSLSYFVYWGFYHYLITLLISLATAFYFHERFQLRVLFSIGVAVASFFLLCTYRLASIISIFLLLSYFATMFFYGRFPLSLSISIVIAIAPYLLLLLFLNTLPEYLYPTCIIPLSLCSAVYLKDRFHWHHKAATAVTVVMAFLIYVFVLFPGLFF